MDATTHRTAHYAIAAGHALVVLLIGAAVLLLSTTGTSTADSSTDTGKAASAVENTTDTACWVEKTASIATAEVICGYRGQRPADSVAIGEVFAGHWVAVHNADGYTFEPAPTN